MDSKLFEQLLYEEETPSLDFKRDQYLFVQATDEEKSELLKDILSFANAWRREDAYILIGVQEVKGGKSNVVGITDHIDDASLQQFVNSKVNKPINFSYEAFMFEGKQVGIIKISIQERPFFLLKNYGKLEKEKVHIRRGSSSEIAKPDEIANMGIANIESKQNPTLSLQFGFKDTRAVTGDNLLLRPNVLLLPDESEIPELRGNGLASLAQMLNPYFYKEFSKYLFWTSLLQPVSLVAYNSSETIAQNVTIQLIQSKLKKLLIMDTSEYPSKPEYSSLHVPTLRNMHTVFDKITTDVEDLGDKWEITLKLGNIQPGAKAWSDEFYIGSSVPHELELTAEIFSDNIRKPIKVDLGISLIPQNRSIDLIELINLATESRK